MNDYLDNVAVKCTYSQALALMYQCLMYCYLEGILKPEYCDY